MVSRLDSNRKQMRKARTANGRFCEMAAVTPQTILCVIERYYPAGTAVEAATSQSRWGVVCKRRERGGEPWKLEL